MDVVTIELPHLGNRTYLVHDGRLALVVDPPRSLGVVERAAREAGVQIAAVADTHVHNDYVSGAPGLARRHGADYLLAADEDVEVARSSVHAGDVAEVGDLRVAVLATPGHTLHHQAFHVTRADGRGPGAVLTGGSMLAGTVGRTDLVDPALAVRLAREQWASVRRLGQLPPETTVHPTHGFGSFCAGGDTCDGGLTIGEQAVLNPALTTDVEPFVRALVAGFGPVPGHYRHMAPLNRAGAGARAVPAPAQLSAEELETARRRGAWLVDLRPRATFAASHVAGSVNVEAGDQLALWVAWVVPWGERLVLLGDDAATLEQAADQLAQVGVEAVSVHVLAAPTLPGPRGGHHRARWSELPRDRADVVLLDVRHPQEVVDEPVTGALAIPLPDLAARVSEVPPGEVWVHCRSGFRAGVAAGLLARAGRRVVHLDDDLAHLPAALRGPVPAPVG